MRNSKKATQIVALTVCALLMMTFIPTITYAVGTTYYVDSIEGNDTNDGTSISTPWQTLQKVGQTALLPGDQILFKRGSSWTGSLWLNRSGDSTGQITYGAYGTGNKPILNANGETNYVFMCKNQDYITIRDIEMINSAATSKDLTGITIFASTRNLTNIQILNCDIHNIKGRYGYDNYYWSAGIYIDAYSGNVDNVLIEGNNIHDNESQGIYTKGTGGTNGIRLNNLVVRNNTFDRNVKGDLIVGKALNPLVEYNIATNAGQGYVGFYYMASMWEFSCNSSLFQFNEVANVNAPDLTGGGDSQAFDVDISSKGTHIFQYNYTHNNEGGTLLVMWTGNENLESTIYRYNISQNDGHFNCNPWDLSAANDGTKGSTITINCSGTVGTYIYNNVWYNNTGDGINIKNSATTYNNNIFYATGTSHYPETAPTYDYNCFYGSDTSVIPYSDIHRVTSNPNFVSPGTGGNGRNTVDGYKLQSDSPCINAGKVIVNNGGRDYWGNSLYTTVPDIGAFESTSTIIPIPTLWPTNLAPSATLSVDSTNGAYTKELAVDGVKNVQTSRWVSTDTAEPHWFELDWPSDKTISSIKVWSGAMNENASGYQINSYRMQSWDGSAWVDIPGASVINNTQDGYKREYNNFIFTALTTNKIRMYITDATAKTGLKDARLLEIEVWGMDAAPINLAPSATLSVDSTNGAYTADLAVDGVKNVQTNRWVSTNTAEPHWFELDWPSEKAISNIKVWSGNMSGSGYQIYSYKMQSWDGSTWVDIPGASVTNNTQDGYAGKYNNLDFPTVITNKIRMYITDATSKAGYQDARLFEIEVWGN